MSGFGWWVRVRDALLAGLAGWLAGVAVVLPFEVGVASRYMSGENESFVRVLIGGTIVWSAFALFMSSIAWMLLVLPVALLVPPRWIARWRYLLIPASPLAGAIAMGLRMHIFQPESFVNINTFLSVFWIPVNVFAMVFALVLTATYAVLAAQRCRSASS